MKKSDSIKRIIACLLAIASLFSLCPVVFANETVSFQDDFSTPALQGWTSDTTGTLTDGAYVMPANTINYVAGHTYERVAISADAMVYTSTKENGFPTGATAYLVARGNEEAGTGYDFGIGVHLNGQTYVRMYRRDVNGISKMLYQSTDPIDGVGAIQPGISYNIKLITTENLVLGYVNDVLVAKIEDDSFTNGSVGLRTLDGEAKFDNVTVTEVPERQIDGITITQHDETISKVGKIHFTGKLVYNSVYGTEDFDQDTDGVTYSGLDGTTGTKTITVSYMNQTTQFGIQVTDKFQSEVIYEDDFADADASWQGGTSKYDNVEYNFVIANGVASVSAPSTALDKPMNVKLARPTSEMEGHNYYSIQVTATITGDSKTPTKRFGTAAVQFAQNAESGEMYEVRLTAEGIIQVYRGSTLLLRRSLEDVTGNKFSYGTAYTLKVCVYNDAAMLYVNGKLISHFADMAGSQSYAAIRSIAGSVKFDNYIATTLEEKGDHALTSISVYSMDYGKAVGNTQQYYFNTADFFLVATYSDGSKIPVNLNDANISAYSPTSSAAQRIVITYGGKSCSVNYAYKPYLFYDNFENGDNTRWVWVENKSLTHEIQNGRMAFTFDPKVTSSTTTRATITGGSEWTDYEVSANVFFNPKSGFLDRYFCLIGRFANNSWYEFRLIYRKEGKMTAALSRFDKGKHVLLQEVTAAQLVNCMENGEVPGTGMLFDMRMSLVGNQIKLYFNNQLVLVYEDNSAGALTKGSAGMRAISNTCIADDFTVAEKKNGVLTGYGLSQFPDGNITVWQGNGIEIWNNDLVLKYADGTQEKVMLTADMLGDFSNTEIGRHEVDVTFADITYPIVVTVQERPEYVQEVIQEIQNFDTFVDVSNMDAFLALKIKYDSLSPYEAGMLGTELTEKWNELLHSYDVCIAPELANETVQEISTLQSDVLGYWGDSIEGNSGKWIQSNSILYQAQAAYGISGTGWKCPDVYGNISGISVDMAVYSDVMYAGVGINVGNDGYYHVRVANTAVDENNAPLYELQMYRKEADGHVKVESIILAAYDIIIEHGVWYNLMLTLEGNTVRAYLDGQMLIQFDEAEQLYALGEAGVRISQGDAVVDNVRVYGTRQEKAADSSSLIEPTTYTDDFEDETVGESPSHWVENYTSSSITDNWQVYSKDTKVYGTQSGSYTQTYLYAFDNNPTITTGFMVEKISSDGEFGLITRMSPTTAFNLVGYDASEEKWYVKSQSSEAEGPKITWQEGTFQLEVNKWYEATLTLKGSLLNFVIDGQEILSMEDVHHTGYGRMGFFTDGASMFVDNYTVIMATGDIPQDGVISYVIDEDTYNNMFEIETIDDGKTLIGVGIDCKYISYDAGLTWKEITDSATYSQVIANNYTTFLKMSNGKYMQILMDDEMKVQISDDFLNWETISNVVPYEDYMQAGWYITLLHVNTATEVKLDDGTSRIFVPVSYRKIVNNIIKGHYTEVYYTDDFGYTWQKSETNTSDILPGATMTEGDTWAESKIIKCADGSLRMYYSRNKLGCMQYTVSYDNGVTWEGFHQITHIQLPMTSFAIMEDPTCPGTFYMVCANGTPDYLGASTPRIRFMLLKSTDGINWEFQMNVERMSEVPSVQNGVELYQILDPSLLITEDYIYIAMGRSEREYAENNANAHQAQRIYYVRVEKDKLSSRDWDASTIANMYYPKTIEFEQAPQTVFGLADLFVCSGTIKLTDFLGNETVVPISENCVVYDEPNMFNLGEGTVHLRYKNGTDLSYTVTIKEYHSIKWDIYGEGTVEPMDSRIYVGESGSYRIVPADGWRISGVFVNEQLVTLNGDILLLENLMQDVEVIVVFEEKGLIDQSWFWVLPIGGVLVLAGVATCLIVLGKKRKNKSKSKSSNSSTEN